MRKTKTPKSIQSSPVNQFSVDQSKRAKFPVQNAMGSPLRECGSECSNSAALCGICKKRLDNYCILCDIHVCNKWICLSCSKVSKDTYNYITKHLHSNAFHFFCNLCDQRFNDFIKPNINSAIPGPSPSLLAPVTPCSEENSVTAPMSNPRFSITPDPK